MVLRKQAIPLPRGSITVMEGFAANKAKVLSFLFFAFFSLKKNQYFHLSFFFFCIALRSNG